MTAASTSSPLLTVLKDGHSDKLRWNLKSSFNITVLIAVDKYLTETTKWRKVNISPWSEASSPWLRLAHHVEAMATRMWVSWSHCINCQKAQEWRLDLSFLSPTQLSWNSNPQEDDAHIQCWPSHLSETPMTGRAVFPWCFWMKSGWQWKTSHLS